jgi:hypothetical protein
MDFWRESVAFWGRGASTLFLSRGWGVGTLRCKWRLSDYSSVNLLILLAIRNKLRKENMPSKCLIIIPL